MKLEGELAFCHPNIDLEPESQSFELNDCNPDSIVCKSKNEEVKENYKRISFDSKSNDGNSSPTQYGMEEFDSEDTENAKRSHDVWFHDSPEEFDSCGNSEDTYSDECVTESQPELMVCCRESNGHLTKDICVDEGVLTMDKVRFENSVDEKDVSKFLPFDTSKTKVSKKDNREISVHFLDVLDLAITVKSDGVPVEHHQSEDLIQRDEGASENFADQKNEMVLPSGPISLQEIAPEARPSRDMGDEVELNHAEVSNEPESPSKHEESKKRAEDSDILARDSNFAPADSVACCSEEEYHQEGSHKCGDFQNPAEPEDERSIVGQVSHCNGESNFSVVGGSSHICYSGPVPFSGNISLRSDSSTTSMRSFAFPILQHEWDCSPVRMAKADKRHQQRHKSWRECVLCCRF